MKKTAQRPKKLSLSPITIKRLTTAGMAEIQGGARPVTSLRPDCGCA